MAHTEIAGNFFLYTNFNLIIQAKAGCERTIKNDEFKNLIEGK